MGVVTTRDRLVYCRKPESADVTRDSERIRAACPGM